MKRGWEGEPLRDATGAPVSFTHDLDVWPGTGAWAPNMLAPRDGERASDGTVDSILGEAALTCLRRGDGLPLDGESPAAGDYEGLAQGSIGEIRRQVDDLVDDDVGPLATGVVAVRRSGRLGTDADGTVRVVRVTYVVGEPGASVGPATALRRLAQTGERGPFDAICPQSGPASPHLPHTPSIYVREA